MKEISSNLDDRFAILTKKAIDCLKKSNTAVGDVVYELSTLPACEKGDWKLFLDENVEKFRKCKDHNELFFDLNLNLTYLSPDLLRHLVKKLPPLQEIEGDIEEYMDDLHKFRRETPLELFHQINKKHIQPPSGFTDIIVKFEELKSRNGPLTLQHVEDLRLQYYIGHHRLYNFALMLRDVTKNCYIITFSVAESVVELLQTNIPKELLRDFGITEVVVSGRCIFSGQNDISQQMMIMPSPMETNPISLLMETSAGICLWT